MDVSLGMSFGISYVVVIDVWTFVEVGCRLLGNFDGRLALTYLLNWYALDTFFQVGGLVLLGSGGMHHRFRWRSRMVKFQGFIVFLQLIARGQHYSGAFLGPFFLDFVPS